MTRIYHNEHCATHVLHTHRHHLKLSRGRLNELLVHRAPPQRQCCKRGFPQLVENRQVQKTATPFHQLQHSVKEGQIREHPQAAGSPETAKYATLLAQDINSRFNNIQKERTCEVLD